MTANGNELVQLSQLKQALDSTNSNIEACMTTISNTSPVYLNSGFQTLQFNQVLYNSNPDVFDITDTNECPSVSQPGLYFVTCQLFVRELPLGQMGQIYISVPNMNEISSAGRGVNYAADNASGYLMLNCSTIFCKTDESKDWVEVSYYTSSKVGYIDAYDSSDDATYYNNLIIIKLK